MYQLIGQRLRPAITNPSSGQTSRGMPHVAREGELVRSTEEARTRSTTLNMKVVEKSLSRRKKVLLAMRT